MSCPPERERRQGSGGSSLCRSATPSGTPSVEISAISSIKRNKGKALRASRGCSRNPDDVGVLLGIEVRSISGYCGS